MAEIKIEKKNPIWPWLVLVFIIIAILYFLVFSNDNPDDLEDQDDMEQLEEESVWDDPDTTSWEEKTDTTVWKIKTDTLSFGMSSLQEYSTHLSDSIKMGGNIEYTNLTILKLVDAVQAKADELKIDIRTDMEQLQKDTKVIQENLSSGGHLKTIKDLGIKLTDILQNIQQQQFPALNKEISRMRSAVSNIDPTVQINQQKEQLNKFFKEAAKVLSAMSSS